MRDALLPVILVLLLILPSASAVGAGLAQGAASPSEDASESVWYTAIQVGLFAIFLLCSLRLARKAGYGWPLAILLSVMPVFGIIFLAFRDWPLEKALRRAERGVHLPERTDLVTEG